MILTILLLLICLLIVWLAIGGRGKDNGVGRFLSCRRITGLDGSEYLVRRYLLPRNKFLNIYLHKFLGSDDDRALHDHPWYSISCVLKGRLIEHRPDGSTREIRRGKDCNSQSQIPTPDRITEWRNCKDVVYYRTSGSNLGFCLPARMDFLERLW